MADDVSFNNDPFAKDAKKAAATTPASSATPPPPPAAGTSMASPPPPPPGGANPTAKNWMGITSLILGLIGGSVLGLIFGIMGLGAVKRGEANNRGIALAGVIISAVWFAVVAIFLIAAVAIDAGQPGRSVAAIDLKRGQCVVDTGNSVEEGELVSIGAVRVVDCTEPHNSEVYARVKFSHVSFPGEEVLADEAESSCINEYLANIPTARQDEVPYFEWFLPDSTSWRLGARDFVCLASIEPGTAQLTKSVLTP